MHYKAIVSDKNLFFQQTNVSLLLILFIVPKNMTNLSQPLDLTTNAIFKKTDKRAFSKHFSSSIMEALKEDPIRDVTTIKVELQLSVS